MIFYDGGKRHLFSSGDKAEDPPQNKFITSHKKSEKRESKSNQKKQKKQKKTKKAA
jgi:hypothetical protein